MTLMPVPRNVSLLSVASSRGPARLSVLPLPTLTKNPPAGKNPNVAGEAVKDTNGADELLDTVPARETSMPLVAVIGAFTVLAFTALRSGPLSAMWLPESTSSKLSPTVNGLPASVTSDAVVELVSETREQQTEIRLAVIVMELSVASSRGPAQRTAALGRERNEPNEVESGPPTSVTRDMADVAVSPLAIAITFSRRMSALSRAFTSCPARRTPLPNRRRSPPTLT